MKYEKLTFDYAINELGELTEEQKAILEDAKENGTPEKELFEKLGVMDDSFGRFIKEASRKDYILSRYVSEEELAEIIGGKDRSVCEQSMDVNCSASHNYRIYDNQFPNCNSTVEDGSWCASSDACYADAIEYTDMKFCDRSWK